MPQSAALVSPRALYAGSAAFNPMDLKTSFSFDLQLPVTAGGTALNRQARMQQLELQLQHALRARDAAAVLASSSSHRGDGNRIVELTTTLQDTDITAILQSFASENSVRITPVE